MTMPSESLRAVKRGRDCWREILVGKRMPQLALREMAYSVLRHYPHDYALNKYWSEDVCVHGSDREFCRECRDELNKGTLSAQSDSNDRTCE